MCDFFPFMSVVGRETQIIKDMRQIITAISERLAAINKDAIAAYFMHSENGLIMHRAIETMQTKWREKIETNVLFIGYGLVLPIPNDFGMRAINIYSEKDQLTLGFKKHWDPAAEYDIRIVESISKWHEKSAFIYDHGFLAPTGKLAIVDVIEEVRGVYRFHRPNIR